MGGSPNVAIRIVLRILTDIVLTIGIVGINKLIKNNRKKGNRRSL